MWIFSKAGFFSVVEHFEHQDFVVVRTRVFADAQNFAKRLELRVEETPEADYPFRMKVNREVFVRWMTAQARDVDYPNFKNEIAKTSRPRASLYEKVWSVMKDAAKALSVR